MQFQFYIENSKEVCSDFEFFKIKEKEDCFSITLFGISDGLKETLILHDETLISFKDCFVSFDFTINKINFIDNSKLELIAPIDSYLDERYNFYAELIYSWKQDIIKYQWFELSKTKKKIYLNCCAKIRSKGKQDFISTSIYLHLKKIKTKLDFYIYFADKCLGYKGYMGTNLDALNDMLRDITQKSIDNTIFYISDFEDFKKRLNKTKNKDADIGKLFRPVSNSYADIILDIFNDFEINYKLI